MNGYMIKPGYRCLIDSMNMEEWNALVPKFSDATVNQTWAWSHGMSAVTSHLVIAKGTEPVAAAMLRIIRVPVTGLRIAYVGAGPMWRLKGKDADKEALKLLLEALRDEYVGKRKMFLRIFPEIFHSSDLADTVCSVYKNAGFILKKTEARTLILDLKPEIGELRKQMNQKWRNQLNAGERAGLAVEIGTGSGFLKNFRKIYLEMIERKDYASPVDIDVISGIQEALPGNLKFRFVICSLGSVPVAGAVFTAIGDTCIYFLGATAREGMRTKASYVVQWEMIKWMKMNGFTRYDLGGCSPAKVPGTYHFKAGLCGKEPVLHRKIGLMDAYKSPADRFIVNSALYLKDLPQLIRRELRAGILNRKKEIEKKATVN
jgi:lipid II:glycine glycyltransferase (peptidoglycan interpeptide bridge formation enzyme)